MLSILSHLPLELCIGIILIHNTYPDISFYIQCVSRYALPYKIRGNTHIVRHVNQDTKVNYDTLMIDQ